MQFTRMHLIGPFVVALVCGLYAGCELEALDDSGANDPTEESVALAEGALGATSYTYAGDAKLCSDITPGTAANAWTYGCVAPKTVYPPSGVVRPLLKLTNINADHRYRIEVYRNGVLLWTHTTGLITVGGGWQQGFFYPVVALDATIASYEVRLYVATNYIGPYTRLATLPFTVAQPRTTGWTSETGYNAPTAVQRAIVALARAKLANGGGSGRTLSGTSQSNPGKWQVDTDGGDGEPLRRAINVYRDFLKAPGAMTVAGLNTAMLNALAGSSYSTAERNSIIARIKEVTLKNPNGTLTPPAAPTTPDGILAYLGIQKQCLEFAMSTALEAGATPSSVVSYSQLSGNNRLPQSQARPGMGLYDVTGTTHAMIIVDIQWSNGTPINYKVIDANFGGGWTHPPGDVMWSRRIRERTVAAQADWVVDAYR